jgi:hypothetical protein
MGGRRCGKRAEWWQVRRANLSRYTLAVRETGEESVWGGEALKRNPRIPAIRRMSAMTFQRRWERARRSIQNEYTAR